MKGALNLFVPGWGAAAGLYRSGLPGGWRAVELPSFAAGGGDLGRYRRRLEDELVRAGGPVELAGHSMGAALAVLVAADHPERVASLLLLAPSGLPLGKPLRASALTFAGQVVRRRYPLREVAHAVASVARAPRAALRLARQVHDLDLTEELGRVRAHRVPSVVVACPADRLATPEHCRRLAALLGAELRTVDDGAGHIWPITSPALLAATLRARGPAGAGAASGARAGEASAGPPAPG